MTFLAKPLGFTSEQFSRFVDGLKWKNWRPSFIVLHNTAEPSLKQWAHFGIGMENGPKRINNLNHYYRDVKKWHSGPHIFVAPDFIWVACDLEHDGVHASCYNSASIGIEMVGDYSYEDFSSGEGAKVRANTVACVAALSKKLNLTPVSLRFHKECVKDHHDCPGKLVDKTDFVNRVTRALG